MSAWLARVVRLDCRALVRSVSAAAGAALAMCAAGCGAGGAGQLAVPAVAPRDDTWPSLGVAPPDALDVRAALSSLDGATLRVRAHLVAVTLPCPTCSVGERAGPAPRPKIGKSPRPRAPDMPGCLPCPAPAATFSDDASSDPGSAAPRIRATGAAEGLQPRHVGKSFLLTGTFHAGAAVGGTGPELEVTDVRALTTPDAP